MPRTLTAPTRHRHDGRILADVDYVHCMHGHESIYERDTVPLLNRREPETVDDDGPTWTCPHADGPENECDDTLNLLPA